MPLNITKQYTYTNTKQYRYWHFEAAESATFYAHALCQLLTLFSKNNWEPNPTEAANKAAYELLKVCNLSNVLSIEDALQIAGGDKFPSPNLQLLLNQLITNNLQISPEILATETDDAPAIASYQKLPLVGETIPAFNILKSIFIAERLHHKMTQADIAGALGVTQTTVSRMENPELAWETSLLTDKAIQAYTGGDTAAAMRLDQLAYAVRYPNGIQSLNELVKFIAIKYYDTIDNMGTTLAIHEFQKKTDPNSRHKLSVADTLVLRDCLQQKLEQLGHLHLPPQHLDQVLPNPLAVKSFAELLGNWANLASGGKESFSTAVAATAGRSLATNSCFNWGQGRGLLNNLDAIIETLETNPNTKELFPAHKEQFIVMAKQAQLPSRNLSEDGKKWLNYISTQPRNGPRDIG